MRHLPTRRQCLNFVTVLVLLGKYLRKSFDANTLNAYRRRTKKIGLLIKYDIFVESHLDYLSSVVITCKRT